MRVNMEGVVKSINRREDGITIYAVNDIGSFLFTTDKSMNVEVEDKLVLTIELPEPISVSNLGKSVKKRRSV